ncbi:DUF411 domain-containing protein [Euryhalocaulis caribicus]|uniref:DUF411 domain-containing protein n=1 Tax=Euryhalocaulis caribicus TaxID=1161401 RepID=UPI0003A75A6C|nr:DUF411 domain-containing protein [Euryhalocaulis caribicus]
MTRSILILIFTLFLPLSAAAQTTATMFKDPFCGCCAGHADYLREHGFEVDVRETSADKLAAIKQRHQIPAPLQSCHTLLIEGYVVEGHVPLEAINRLLAQKPDIIGISLPGMPAGSPGMGGQKSAPFVVLTIGGNNAPFGQF